MKGDPRLCALLVQQRGKLLNWID